MFAGKLKNSAILSALFLDHFLSIAPFIRIQINWKPKLMISTSEFKLALYFDEY